jgi:hypothetical protein
MRGLYVFTFGSDLSVKAVFLRPTDWTAPWLRRGWSGGVRLTDGRIFFRLQDDRRRRDLPLFEDVEIELPPPIPPTLVGDFEGPPVVEGRRGGPSFLKSASSDADFGSDS